MQQIFSSCGKCEAGTAVPVLLNCFRCSLTQWGQVSEICYSLVISGNVQMLGVGVCYMLQSFLLHTLVHHRACSHYPQTKQFVTCVHMTCQDGIKIVVSISLLHCSW